MSFWFKLEVPHTGEKQENTVSLQRACSPRNGKANNQGQKWMEISNKTHRRLYFPTFSVYSIRLTGTHTRKVILSL